MQAFLEAKATTRGSIEVELRESAPTSDPRSGRPLFVPPVVVLWIAERPVVVRVRGVVAISRFPPEPRMVSMLEGGYDLSALGRSATQHIKVLAGLS